MKLLPDAPIFMDHHATTPVDPRVLQAMLPFFSNDFGNPASRHHAWGWKAESAVELARSRIARLLNCSEAEVFFTSGATESNNLALLGVLQSFKQVRKHVITSQIEHASVLQTLKFAEAHLGVELTVLEVGEDGRVSVDDFLKAIRPETVLASIMMANNEIGTLQPILELSTIAHQHGVFFHTDAAQSFGRIPVNVQDLKVDLVSLTSHKIYGPKGVGAIYRRRRDPRVVIEPLFHGGNHEHGLRPGTLNVPGIVGFGLAAELAAQEMASESRRLAQLRDRLWANLQRLIPGVKLNGSAEFRLPHNLNIQVPGIDGEMLMADLKDVAISSGSACTEADQKRSHVLLSMGLTDEEIQSSLRFGLGRSNTEAQVDWLAERISQWVKETKELGNVEESYVHRCS